MSRYRKSIRQTLIEVGEWQEAPAPLEVLVEEAPIPTETGRELLKKRIAHKKVEKKEIKYYPMGDVFRGKLHKTTQHLKEALELDEIDEAVKWEVKVTGLPVFYSDGRSKGAVRQMLRKLLKHPDDIQSINRVTSAELKKIRRGQIAGDEPGDEDEDKNPVGPSYNEGEEPRIIRPQKKLHWGKGGKYSSKETKRRGADDYEGDHEREEVELAIMSLDHKEAPRKLKLTQQGLEAFKQSRDEGFEGPFTAAGSGSIAKQRKAKAGDENKSIEQQMADARRGKLAFQED